MKKVFKKSIACLIAVLMVFSTMPLSAFAWDTGLKFTKKDTSWTDYPGKYSAYISNGVDYAGIVLKEVNNNGVITVTRGQSFKITLSCGKWIKQKASNGVPQTDTLSWYFGESDGYVLSTRDANGYGEGTKWKAFLGDDTSKEIQSNITGEFATATNGPLDKYRATKGDGGTNEAYGVFEFTTSSFPQLNTPGEYTVRLAPTIIMNTWTSKGWFQGSEWRNTKGWGAIDWSIANENPINLDGRTISITVKVVCPHTSTRLEWDLAPTCTKAGSTGDLICNDCGATISPATPISPLGHSFTNYTVTKDATCSATGTKVASCDRNCGATDEKTIPINSNAHNWGEWNSISDTQHQRECTNDNSHTEIGNHTFENGVCTVCSKPQTFTIKFKNQDGSEISSKVYNYGDPVAIPDLPPTKYTYNNETHTVTTYSWNSTPNPVAQGNATYQVTATNSSPVACNFVWKNSTTVDGKTIDTLECSVCKGTISKTVADMSALNHAIEQLEALVNADGANYKYESTALANAKNVVATAKSYAQTADKYALQSEVDAQASTVNNTITTLTTTGLAKYTITVKVVNSEDAKDEGVNGLGKTYTDIPYGKTFSHTVNIPTIDDGSSLTGLPKYAVYKWMVGDVKLNTTDTSISGVVKGNATYTCYVLPFKATDDTKKETRVRYLDKSGNTLKIAYAEVGSKYEIDPSVSAPIIPYYNFAEWNLLFGTPENVGTREIVYKATYTYSDSKANVCEIVGLGGVKVNGAERCSAIYDSKVVLTGATKYAFCDKDGNKIISYINEDYIYTPRVNETVYIKAVVEEVTTATTAITGSFIQKDAGTLSNGTKYHNLYVNAQFYLPEGATAVEAGLVLSKSVSEENELQIGKDKVTKLVSNSQGTNHEYSMAMGFTKDGNVHARSYLIYVDKSGTTHTVYSAVKTIEYKA